jgi:hypothetical protein
MSMMVTIAITPKPSKISLIGGAPYCDCGAAMCGVCRVVMGNKLALKMLLVLSITAYALFAGTTLYFS